MRGWVWDPGTRLCSFVHTYTYYTTRTYVHVCMVLPFAFHFERGIRNWKFVPCARDRDVNIPITCMHIYIILYIILYSMHLHACLHAACTEHELTVLCIYYVSSRCSTCFQVMYCGDGRKKSAWWYWHWQSVVSSLVAPGEHTTNRNVTV